mmetsp:Transcript_5973/g.9296  ORF Transcript_5973/g.9296 Transcript_5973/m.9296 type:complete len:352 (+) Transcript_5973:217-1272(+)
MSSPRMNSNLKIQNNTVKNENKTISKISSKLNKNSIYLNFKNFNSSNLLGYRSFYINMKIFCEFENFYLKYFNDPTPMDNYFPNNLNIQISSTRINELLDTINEVHKTISINYWKNAPNSYVFHKLNPEISHAISKSLCSFVYYCFLRYNPDKKWKINYWIHSSIRIMQHNIVKIIPFEGLLDLLKNIYLKSKHKGIFKIWLISLIREIKNKISNEKKFQYYFSGARLLLYGLICESNFNGLLKNLKIPSKNDLFNKKLIWQYIQKILYPNSYEINSNKNQFIKYSIKPIKSKLYHLSVRKAPNGAGTETYKKFEKTIYFSSLKYKLSTKIYFSPKSLKKKKHVKLDYSFE